MGIANCGLYCMEHALLKILIAAGFFFSTIANALPVVETNVDKSGWLNAVQLHADLSQLGKMRRGSPNPCEKQPCTDPSRERYSQAVKRLSENWLPKVKDAVRHGDPLAKVILCKRMLLNVGPNDAETDSICSGNGNLLAKYEPRFLSSGLGINFEERYLQAKKKRGAPGGNSLMLIALMKEALDQLMLGDFSLSAKFGAVPAWLEDSTTIQMEDRTKAELIRLYFLLNSVSANARRFYIAGGGAFWVLYGSYETDGTTPTPPACAENYFFLSLYRCPVKFKQNHQIFGFDKRVYYSLDPVKLQSSGINDPAAFKREVHERVAQIEKNIAEDIKRDPRWAIFLIERELTGKLGEAPDQLILSPVEIPTGTR
jgi:hypothetical protein